MRTDKTTPLPSPTPSSCTLNNEQRGTGRHMRPGLDNAGAPGAAAGQGAEQISGTEPELGTRGQMSPTRAGFHVPRATWGDGGAWVTLRGAGRWQW